MANLPKPLKLDCDVFVLIYDKDLKEFQLALEGNKALGLSDITHNLGGIEETVKYFTWILNFPQYDAEYLVDMAINFTSAQYEISTGRVLAVDFNPERKEKYPGIFDKKDDGVVKMKPCLLSDV